MLGGLRRVQAGRLSGGMEQRLALVCALVHQPELVFLDEPTAGVDPANRQRLWDFLYTLGEGGTSLFVTTHYLDEAERCHAVGFMLDGRLVADGEPHLMRERLRDRLVGVEVRRGVEARRFGVFVQMPIEVRLSIRQQHPVRDDHRETARRWYCTGEPE